MEAYVVSCVVPMIAAHETCTAILAAGACGYHDARPSGIRSELVVADRNTHRESELCQSRRRQHVELVKHACDGMFRVGSVERREGGFRKPKHRGVEFIGHIHNHLHGLLRDHGSGEYFRYRREHDASADRHIVSVAD